MVHNYSRRAGIAIAVLVALLLLTIPVVAVGAEEIEVTCGTSGLDPLGPQPASAFCGLGQRLTIPNRLVTEIGYRIWKQGNPTGDVIFSIRNYATGKAIVSVVWGDASELPDPEEGGIQKVRLDEPVRVNGEVVVGVEFYGGNATDYCWAGYRTGNYRDDESYINYYHYGSWHDIGEAEEGGYYYAYVDENAVDPPQNGGNGGDNSGTGDDTTGWIITGSALGALVVGGGLMIRRERKRQRTPRQ